ncbi:MAG TPA: ferric reductase-like transmembrane domain-containing protein [Gaiellaceae bacterium]|nr:ferric reductase-like transmembrane domain-containing protein [Gaiellaceae bacterium]
MGSLTAAPVWYLMRGSGVVTLLLLTAVVMLGVATTSRWRPGRLPRFVTLGLHRSISLLAVVFLAVHIVAALADPYAQVRVLQVVLPLPLGPYPLWLGLGALSLDFLVAVIVTSLLRHRLGRRTWKSVHWLAYASWPLAFAHGLGMGSDARTAWFLALASASLAAVVLAAAWRLLGSRREHDKYLGAPLESGGTA